MFEISATSASERIFEILSSRSRAIDQTNHYLLATTDPKQIQEFKTLPSNFETGDFPSTRAPDSGMICTSAGFFAVWLRT